MRVHRPTVVIGVAGAALWLLHVRLEGAVLPWLPVHGACLDGVGGWADLARGKRPHPPCLAGAREIDCCPAARGFCEPAETLASDVTLGLPIRVVARAHALSARCPAVTLPLDDVTLPPGTRRALALDTHGIVADPWNDEPIAIHGLWGDAIAERAYLGDGDALDLLADLVLLDGTYRPAAVRALARDPGRGLHRALILAAAHPQRYANTAPPLDLAPGQPAPSDALDALTGSGDATHALLVEAGAVRAFVGTDRVRLEAALFSPASAGSPPGDVHGAFVAGGGSPGATALAAALVWGAVDALWVPGLGVQVGAEAPPDAPISESGASGWWLDGCSAPRRAEMTQIIDGQAASPLALALAERVGAWLRVGEWARARDAEALLQGAIVGPTPSWAPRIFLSDDGGKTADPRTRADLVAGTRTADELAVSAWAAHVGHDDDLARMLLRDPPSDPWPRYTWETVANALGEPSDPAVRPEGCPPPLWPGPV